MKRFVSTMLCVMLLLQMTVVSIRAESSSEQTITVDTGNGNIKEYTALTDEGEIFLSSDDVGSIGGYVCDIGERIGFSKDPGASFYQFDIDFDGEVHIKNNTYQIKIKKQDDKYYLPLEKMLYLMHATWCVEDEVLYVNTTPYSIFDFFEDFYEDLCQELTTDADLLMNGESDLMRSIRSSLANMIRNFDSIYYIPFWGVNESIEEDYENILMKLTETKEQYMGEVPTAMIDGELQDTLFDEISQENTKLKFMIDLPLKVDGVGTDLTRLFEAYKDSDNVSYKIAKNVDIEQVFDKNQLNALSEDLGNISDGISLLGALSNIAEVALRANEMNDTFLEQLSILRDFDSSKYQGAAVQSIKNAASNLIKTKHDSISAVSEKSVEEAIDIWGGKAAELTFTGKAVAAVQTADVVLSSISKDYSNSMDAAMISYMLGQSINLEFIALRELTSMVQDMNDLDYQYTQESAEKVRNAALLYLNLNLRDKSYIYYLNSINNNENSWAESEKARQMKEDFAQVQAMRAALISTKDSDEQIGLEDFEHIYSDTPGMTREKISEEILHEEMNVTDTSNAVKDNTDWKEIYSSYIRSIQSEGWSGYKLIYIDEDNVPELYIMGSFVAQGQEVCTIKDGQVQMLACGGDAGVRYIEKENLFCETGGRMDVYHDYIYQIIDGEFVLISKGEYGAENNSNVEVDAQGRPIYQYFWNDNQVAEESYWQELQNAFPSERAVEAYENMFSVEEILQQIEAM